MSIQMTYENKPEVLPDLFRYLVDQSVQTFIWIPEQVREFAWRTEIPKNEINSIWEEA